MKCVKALILSNILEPPPKANLDTNISGKTTNLYAINVPCQVTWDAIAKLGGEMDLGTAAGQ